METRLKSDTFTFVFNVHFVPNKQTLKRKSLTVRMCLQNKDTSVEGNMFRATDVVFLGEVFQYEHFSIREAWLVINVGIKNPVLCQIFLGNWRKE